jgi:hypothetical protein
MKPIDRYQDKMVRLGAIQIDAKKSVDEIVQSILEQSR